MRKNMKNKLLILLLLFTTNFAFGQQISVQNNELKYRITGGTIRTAADKAIFQAKIDALSSRIIADSTALLLKANINSPTFTGTVVLPSTTSIGTVSSTELGYIDGLTSSAQTQIDGKFATPIGLTSGTLSKWNGSKFINSIMSETSTNINVGGGISSTYLSGTDTILKTVNGLITRAIDGTDYYSPATIASANYWTLASGNVYRPTGKVFVGHSADMGAYSFQVTGNSIFSGSIIVGQTATDPLAKQLIIRPTIHATSRRAAISFGNFGQLISDVFANGTNDFGLYNVNTSQYPIFVKYSNDFVGLGIIDPRQKLHVGGNVFVPLTNSYFSYSTDFGFGTPDSNGLQIFGGDSGIRLGRRASNVFTDRMFINTITGNVGIGTTDPTSKLQVVGLPTYADNAAATSGGLTAGAFYRTSVGVLMVVY